MKLQEKKHHRKNSLLALGLIGVIFAGLTGSFIIQEAEPDIQWKEFSSKEEGISLFMPDVPRKKSVSPPSPKGQIIRYDSIFENLPWYSVLFNFAIIRLPENQIQGKTPRQLFDEITAPARANKTWIIMREQAVSYGEYQGIDIKLRIPPFKKFGRTKSRARLIVLKDRVYLLQTTYVPKTIFFSRLEGGNISRFFNSFKISSPIPPSSKPA